MKKYMAYDLVAKKKVIVRNPKKTLMNGRTLIRGISPITGNKISVFIKK